MKKRYVIAALAISLGLSACSNNGEVEEQPQDEPQEEVQDQPEEEGQPEDAASEEEQDPATSEEEPSLSLGAEEELQEEIASQPGIVDVMVQVEEGSANRINADIEINDEQELSPEEVAETYAELIKEKYPDHAVDIIIIQDGQMLTQAQFE
ncbi:hypothetical protein M3202_16185 [Alkalihalobacillus oceani]|uniref:GerMN domain-containing protein n=1 Tax=Halalkalibacter oceani TaxID=1653776 RepID=A0A9X2DRZ6_9BACI|nr:hypothetical protein [Halalkalibacter oceani]MCM3715606.1 hypothetical protein [Halalkalibacter oceani]